MLSSDEPDRRVIHAGPFELGVERELWVITLGKDGNPTSISQEFETPGVSTFGKSAYRSGKVIPASEFYTSLDIPNDVRSKLYKFIQNGNV